MALSNSDDMSVCFGCLISNYLSFDERLIVSAVSDSVTFGCFIADYITVTHHLHYVYVIQPLAVGGVCSVIVC